MNKQAHLIPQIPSVPPMSEQDKKDFAESYHAKPTSDSQRVLMETDFHIPEKDLKIPGLPDQPPRTKKETEDFIASSQLAADSDLGKSFLQTDFGVPPEDRDVAKMPK